MRKANQRTRALFEQAKRYMPYGVNSNFRYWGDEHTPIMQRGKGAYVWDADDNKYVVEDAVKSVFGGKAAYRQAA